MAVFLQRIFIKHNKYCAKKYRFYGSYMSASSLNGKTQGYKRMAYAQAVNRFLRWCDEKGYHLEDLNPIVVASYIEAHSESNPTIKQHLAAIRKFFDYLVLGHIVLSYPATSVQDS
jgi:site-specific recombinase XerD